MSVCKDLHFNIFFFSNEWIEVQYVGMRLDEGAKVGVNSLQVKGFACLIMPLLCLSGRICIK